MLERLGMLFVVCGAFGMTDLAGVRLASGFCMLARILCHIHVSDVVHVFVFVSVSKIEDQHARRVVVQQHSFRIAGAMECWLLGEQIATSRPGVSVFIVSALGSDPQSGKGREPFRSQQRMFRQAWCAFGSSHLAKVRNHRQCFAVSFAALAA